VPAVDYLIVGSGLTGAVIARMLADAGRDVLVVERRSHLGGNVHDHVHAESGIRVHTYGPHYFRTASSEIWAFVRRFAEFRPYEAVVRTLVDGQLESWPVAASYVQRVVGDDWVPGFRGRRPANFEEAALAKMPRVVYERFVKGYTEKQWGVPARALAAELARRFDLRSDDDPRLARHRHQGIPVNGYAAFMVKLLAGIPVVLGCDFLRERPAFVARRLLVYTGAIDEFYGFDLGRLGYRAQRREETHHADVEFAQPCVQVNNPNPDGGAHIRTLEWRHLMPAPCAASLRGTVLTRETPFTPTDPDRYEYPFPSEANAALYRRYRARADAEAGVLVCGRLGEYRYFDMDQAIARARTLARRIIRERAGTPIRLAGGTGS
jgi:UDP-galactopyranose mutase